MIFTDEQLAAAGFQPTTVAGQYFRHLPNGNLQTINYAQADRRSHFVNEYYKVLKPDQHKLVTVYYLEEPQDLADLIFNGSTYRKILMRRA